MLKYSGAALLEMLLADMCKATNLAAPVIFLPLIGCTPKSRNKEDGRV